MKLTDAFPLRRTTVWGGFRANDPIPVRYGTVRGKCVEYATANRDEVARLKWVWSDGACEAIDAVYIDGQLQQGWTAANAVDVTGAAVMMVTLTRPAPQGAEVTAIGRGRVSGTMIQNPALVIADLLSIAGIGLPDLGVFEVECERLGLVLSGELSEGSTIQGAIRSACESSGARYSSRMRGTAMIYPGGSPELVGSDPHIRAYLDLDNITSARCDLDSAINALTITYAMRDGSASKAIELEAADSIVSIGRRSKELRAEWIGTDGLAANVGTRLLGFLARTPYIVEFSGVRGDLRPGDWVSVDATNSRVPFADGAHQVIATAYDPIEGMSAGAFEIYYGSAPAIAIVRTSNIIEDEQQASAQQRIVGSSRQITLTGGDGSILGNRKVILDGRVTRFSDGAGVVTFPLADTPPGAHELEIFLQVVANVPAYTIAGEGEGGPTFIPGTSQLIPTSIRITVVFA